MTSFIFQYVDYGTEARALHAAVHTYLKPALQCQLIEVAEDPHYAAKEFINDYAEEGGWLEAVPLQTVARTLRREAEWRTAHLCEDEVNGGWFLRYAANGTWEDVPLYSDDAEEAKAEAARFFQRESWDD